MADRSYFGFTGKRVPRWLAGTTAAAIILLGMPALSLAPAAATNVGGFEIDGNFTPNDDSPPGEDWGSLSGATGLLSPTSAAFFREFQTEDDNTVGGQDNTSLGSSNKESNWGTWSATNSTNVTGKSDFGRVAAYAYVDKASGHQFLNLGFDRGAPKGGQATDAFYFELNQAIQGTVTYDVNGVPVTVSNPNPVRTPGDIRILIFDQGSQTVSAPVFWRWTIDTQNPDGYWKPLSSKTEVYAVSTNASAVGDLPSWWTSTNVTKNGTVDTQSFIEASLDLDSFGAQLGCPSKGFAALNARSVTGGADGSWDNLQDYINALPLFIPSKCAALNINKIDPAGAPLAGATFTISPDPTPGSTKPSLTVTDGGTGDSDGKADGTISLPAVTPDIQYSVQETTPPLGYIPDPTPQLITLAEYATGPLAGSLTFRDSLGSVAWTKKDAATGNLLAGATFEVKATDGAAAAAPWNIDITVPDNTGQAGYTGRDTNTTEGAFAVSGLPTGTYSVQETAAPTGYAVDQNLGQFTIASTDVAKVTLANSTTTYVFSDPRLAGGVVIKKTLMDGTTAITCQQDGTGCGTQFQLLQSPTGDAGSFTPYTGTFKVDGATQSGSSTVNVGTNGTATVTGLPWDFYYAFKEITPPAGYNLPATTLSGTVHITKQVADDQANKGAALSVLSVGDPRTVVTTKAQGQDGFALNLPTTTKLYDQATISGVTDPDTTDGLPVGTISYYLYKVGAGGTLTCSSTTVGTGGLVWAAGPYDVAGSGTVTMPQADGYVPTAPGDYYWHAVFTSKYPGLVRNGAEACGSASEKVTVSKAPTGIGTVATPQSVQLTANGAAITDVVTVTGLTSDATGTINVWLSGIDGICPNPTTATPMASATLGNGPGQLVPQPDGKGAYYVTFTTPPTTVYQAGSYKWLAAYSGDANNDAVTHACGAVDQAKGLLEVTTVTKASPSIATTASAVGNDTTLPGVSVTDTATVSGVAVSPNETDLGTVTFRLYGPFTSDTPASDTCSVALYTSPQPVLLVPVNGNWQASVSPSVDLTQAGRYRWVASYSGDEDNNATAGACIDPNELVTVAKANTSIVTQATDGAAPLTADPASTTTVSDSATVSGLTTDAKGTVTFTLYGPVNDGNAANPCLNEKPPSTLNNVYWTSSAIPLSAVSGGSATASTGPVTVSLPAGQNLGYFFWIASYSGDKNNLAVAGVCPDPTERSMVTRTGIPHLDKSSPTENTTVLPGDTIHYVVTLSNTGGLPVTSNLVDTLPAGVTPVANTFTKDGSAFAPTSVVGGVITWSNVTVNAGQTVVFAYDVTVNANVSAGTLTNTATWAGQSDRTVHTVAPAHPTLDKSSPTEFGSQDNASGNVLPGDTIHYILTLGNTGGAQVTSDLVDTLPSWVTNPRNFEVTTGTYSPAIPNISGSTLTWKNVTLGHDQSLVVEFDVTVAAEAPAGDLINQAAWAGLTDTTKHVVAPGVPTFDKFSPTELGSTLNPTGVVLPGSTIHYVLTMGNTGAAAVTSDLVDTLPTWVSSPSNFTVTHGFVVSATPALSNGGQTLTWPSVTVPHGDSVVIEFDAVVSPDAPAGNLVNSAAWAKIVDTTTHVVQPGVPGIDKWSPTEKGSEGNPSGVVLPGDTIDYTVTVTNTGGAAVTSDLVDTLPAGVTVVPGSFNVDPESIDSNGTVITWSDVRVDAGQSVSFTFQVTVNANVAAGDLRNDATWAGKSDHTIHVVEPGVPHIDKSSPTEKGSVVNPSGNVDAGGTITYTIKISNTGGSQLTSDLVDTLPAGVVPVDGSFSTAPSSFDGTTLVWKSITLAPAATFSVTFQVTVDRGHTPGQLVNTATWSGESDQTVHVVPPGVPGLDKSSPTEQGSEANPTGNVNPGDTIHYSIVLKNTGGSAITSDLVDTLPAGVTPVAGTFSPSAPTINGSTLTWSNVTVGAKSTVQFTFDVTVDVTAAAGPLVNTATWDEQTDKTTHNVVLEPVLAPNPTLVKTADPAAGTAVQRGQVVTYTVKVGNTGKAAAVGDLVDTLPAGVTPVADSFTKDGAAFAPDSITATTITWKNVTVQPGQTITFTYQVTVATDAAGPDLVNTAKWLGLVSSTSHPLTIPELPKTGAPFDPISVALWASMLLALGVMFLVFGRRNDENEG